ncbi:MAG TPA: aldehyde dehydrogenase, partial [Puia sp.]|nr:aldehyde dehydrogenase [Puia sp.]
MNSILEKQKTYFSQNFTKPVDFRIQQLKKLREVLKKEEKLLYDAIYADFGKSNFDTYLTEFAVPYNELDIAISHLKRWAKIKKVRTDMVNFPGSSYIIPEPLGVCLVIGAWNYPINLSLTPMISAIAAGNTVILKPSELTVNTSAALAHIINDHFDSAFLTVVEGGIAETTALLENKFDKIFFTGSASVGKIVYQAAAKYLTPVTLELGGKSPAIIEKDASLSMAARRLVWAKFLNAGQTCVAPDYILVHQSVEKELLEKLKLEIRQSEFSLANGNYVQIINNKNLDRLKDLVDEDKIFFGGQTDQGKRTMSPTILSNVLQTDKIMNEEIFGPVLPVLSYEDLDSAIAFVKSKSKPLSLYLFTNNDVVRKKILSEISFGGGAVNDAVMHFSNSRLPFGGVGHSGMGSYHGKAGFDTFTHYKS